MSKKRLTSDDIEVWQRVAGQTEALNPARKQYDVSLPSAPKRKPQTKQPIQPFSIEGSAAPNGHVLTPSITSQMKAQPVAMDRKAFGKMKRGKLSPEGRIDLHGMTLDQAHPALMRFLMSANDQGKRLVLVITGKGKSRDDGGPIPVRHGVLKHQVPQWLRLAPLSGIVLQISQAHISHGGSGAYYVYLRRQR